MGLHLQQAVPRPPKYFPKQGEKARGNREMGTNRECSYSGFQCKSNSRPPLLASRLMRQP